MHKSKVDLIKKNRENQTNYGYLNQVALIQSSGSGKSRMVDELAKLMPTIPINLRASADTKRESSGCYHLQTLTDRRTQNTHILLPTPPSEIFSFKNPFLSTMPYFKRVSIEF
ncbi:hypothetical protein K435DRAFT_110563 [Dendrothele bispora CBS 962.96]|uniref:Uncharacterized protein n=1 Tax=Dendrothele bispora (strain CBS 962.96) TaxID=1314807 RepID=A0A4S8M2U2_DENBC|nr:hypothetical protein K435DRAFT_110563 [Dendrothele bispora CBS 962.96]